MLHYMDDLDSKMEAMRAQFEREAMLDGPWTSYNASLGRPLLNSEKFINPPKPAAAPEAVSEPVSDHHESSTESAEQAPMPGLVPQR